MRTEVNGVQIWNNKIPGREIPGTTRVPIEEISKFFDNQTSNLAGLDLGSGSGRGSIQLASSISRNIICLDLSLEGLRLTPLSSKVQASATELPFSEQAFDFINACGVMTNLCHQDPSQSIMMRNQLFQEAHRTLKPGGLLVVSDFGSRHQIDEYDEYYERHELITEEYRTIAVLEVGTTLKGRTNEQVRELRGTNQVIRYAHHYSTEELIGLYINNKFRVINHSVELTQTPRGKKTIENIIMLGQKI